MQKDVEKFRKDQILLSKKIRISDDFDKLELVAGVDQVFHENKIISQVIVMDYKTKKVIETKSVILDETIPYIPTYLSYREGPAIIQAINELENKPDILIVDGHGISHPRRVGLASYVGLLLDIPAIGVAKHLIHGEVQEGKIICNEKICGSELITKEHANPIYVSPGFRISLKTALKIIKECIVDPHKLPEPLYLAHRYAKKQITSSKPLYTL